MEKVLSLCICMHPNKHTSRKRRIHWRIPPMFPPDNVTCIRTQSKYMFDAHWSGNRHRDCSGQDTDRQEMMCQRRRCIDMKQRGIGWQRQRQGPEVGSVKYTLRTFARCRRVVVMICNTHKHWDIQYAWAGTQDTNRYEGRYSVVNTDRKEMMYGSDTQAAPCRQRCVGWKRQRQGLESESGTYTPCAFAQCGIAVVYIVY